jgi:signal transduction histidine kinase
VARGGDQLVEKQPVPFAVTTVLESVRDIIRPIAEEKQLTVRLLPPVADHRIGHPVAISRMLLNLTTNALKFTETGFVEIVTRELEGDRVEFAVRDSGKGIAPQVLDTLWQPMRRADGGSGYAFSPARLGLMMCRKLVAAMGSELRVETRVGWGSRFYFELTLPKCPEPQPHESTSLPPRPRRGKRGRPQDGRSDAPPTMSRLPVAARSPGVGTVTTFSADP